MTLIFWRILGEPGSRQVETSRDTRRSWETHEKIHQVLLLFETFGYLGCPALVNQMALQRMWRMELWILLKDKKSWHPWFLDVSWHWAQNLHWSQLFWLCFVIRGFLWLPNDVKASSCQQPTDFVACFGDAFPNRWKSQLFQQIFV